MQNFKEFMVELAITILALLIEFVVGTIFLYVACQCFGKEFTWSLAVGVFALMQMVCMYLRVTLATTKLQNK